MKNTLLSICLTMAPLCAFAQNGSVNLNLDHENPLSKWGRWTYFEQGSHNYGLKLQQNRNRMPLIAHWQQGNWVFKYNQDVLSDRHDLFFGLRVSENKNQTTSIGCMSKQGKNGGGSALCGVQFDMSLK